MLRLRRHRRKMPLACERLLLPRRTRADSTIPAVVADPIYRDVVVDHRGVVNVMNIRDVHIVHRPVIEKPAAIPASAIVAVAEISIPVIDAAVETNLRSPISLIEKISIAAISPIPGSPEISDPRRAHPRSRHPVVVPEIVVVSPVAGRPEEPFPRTKRLLIHRQRRRSKGHRKNNSRSRTRRHSQHHRRQNYKREHHRPNRADVNHAFPFASPSFAFPVLICSCGLRGSRDELSPQQSARLNLRSLNLVAELDPQSCTRQACRRYSPVPLIFWNQAFRRRLPKTLFEKGTASQLAQKTPRDSRSSGGHHSCREFR